MKIVFNKEKLITTFLLIIGIYIQISPIVLIPKIITLGGLLLLLLLFINLVDLKKINIGLGGLWYLIFYLFVLSTITYTVNKTSPEYVIIRITLILAIVIMTAPFLNNKKNILKFFNGIYIGGILGILIVLIVQFKLIGNKRLGSGVYGSQAEFGLICSNTMIAFIFINKYMKKNIIIKSLIYILLFSVILLSGARKAIFISILVPVFIKLLNKKEKISKKILALLGIGILIIGIVFFALNNEYLYKSIGFRIESGISAILGKEETDASLSERKRFKDLAKELFLQNPILGLGVHGYAEINQNVNNRYLYSHNGFFEILSCYGIIGFIIYYGIYIYIFIKNDKFRKDSINLFLLSFIIVNLLMEIYSISFLNNLSVITTIIIINNINNNKISKREK